MSITLRSDIRITHAVQMFCVVSDPEDLAADHSQEMGCLPQQLHPGTYRYCL